MKKKQPAHEWVDVKSKEELKPGDRIRYEDDAQARAGVWLGDRDDLARIVGKRGSISNSVFHTRDLFSAWDRVQALRPRPARRPARFRFKPNKCVDGKDNSPSNGTRAEWAETAVHAFLGATGEPDDVDCDSVRDLMADLLHLCDRQGIDARALAGTAVADWERER